MRLKYFLRGAGTGVVVTAILFLVLLTALDWGPRSEMRQAAEQAEDGTNKLVGESGKDYLEAEKQKQEEDAKSDEEKADADKLDVDKTDAANAGDVTVESDSKSEESKTQEASETEQKTNTSENTSSAEGVKKEDKTTDNSADKDKVAEPTKPNVTKTVSFSIKDGEGSDGIAANLKTLGLVDDAKKFNDYLAANGYDRRLRTGNFNVPTGMSYKDLAEMLCKKPE